MEDDVDGDYSGLDEPFLKSPSATVTGPRLILNIDDENDILQLNQVEESPSVDQTPIVKDLPKVDPEAWKEEVERLAPQLKVFLGLTPLYLFDIFRLHFAQTRKIGDKELIN